MTELRVDYNAIKREKDVLELRLEDLNRKQQSTVDSLDKVESDCDRLGKEKVSDSIIAALLASQVKSGITLRETWSRRQAGAMRPVRRAGWVWAASGAPAAKSCAG